MEVGSVGYAKEKKFMAARNLDKATLLVWVIVHEWCHLYNGMQHHKNEFFDLVGKKYDWLMQDISNK
jgi:predicted metal-dependent hydrolase